MSEDPIIRAVATAVPAHALSQADVKAWAARRFNGRAAAMDRLLPAFDNAGIDTRYSCVPLDWYDTAPGWRDKNALYIKHATGLAADAAERCLAAAGVAAAEVDCLVTVSTSGIATPSLDARLLSEMDFRPDTQRLPVFGLGCAGGVLGMGRAADLARARQGRLVLLVVVELCGLTFRSRDRSKSNVIASALFGDGAAAALLSTAGDGPAITGWGEHTWPDSLGVMGWSVEDDGLGVVFSRDIPTIVRRDFAAAVAAYLADGALTLDDVDGFICHPGGAKVVDALEEVFGCTDRGLDLTRRTLRDFGNMSAASVMFVLEQSLAAARPGRYLMTALGPGFTAGFATIRMP
ncbi:MAG: type III polyketide synthase [Magnetovibrio sp.]|nr:type III polyketide synthase [Magnetovibrio sp.]